jgi:hypothetical protein
MLLAIERLCCAGIGPPPAVPGAGHPLGALRFISWSNRGCPGLAGGAAYGGTSIEVVCGLVVEDLREHCDQP